MSFPTLTIGKAKRSGKGGGKSREFSARLLGMMTGPRFWQREWGECSGQPLWLAYVEREQEARAFTANLRAGERVSLNEGEWALESRKPYRFAEQPTPEGLIVFAYIPELFDLEPTSPYLDSARFIFAPPAWWLDRQAAELEAAFGEDAREAARAALFTAYLDRRTSLPILADLRFQLRLYRAAREQPWIDNGGASYYDLCFTQPVAIRGLEAPFGVRASEVEISELISTQTQLFAEEEARHGTTRFETSGRILSYPSTAPTQLSFDFDLALAAG